MALATPAWAQEDTPAPALPTPDAELLEILDLLESADLLELLEEWDPEDALPIPLEETSTEPKP